MIMSIYNLIFEWLYEQPLFGNTILHFFKLIIHYDTTL